jgi:hypothetical protein
MDYRVECILLEAKIRAEERRQLAHRTDRILSMTLPHLIRHSPSQL